VATIGKAPEPAGEEAQLKASAAAALAACAASWAGTATATAQQRAIDTSKSVMTVRVFKAGLFSALGHNHEISAPIAGGIVDINARQVELRAQAGALKVLDPGTSEKDRSEIQRTMLGADVLDAASHPDIVFRSTGAEAAGPGAWRVHGNLTLHGQTHTVDVEVRADGERFVGTSRFRQTEFGIQPVKVAGGTIRVKDEVRIEFNIQLTP
jgi:polyisoprenoid-binding protein YceI